MKSISLSYLAKEGDLKSDYIYLKGSTGIRYRSLALYIPSYGWVPCSKKLKANFTCNPEKLMLVLEDDKDINNVTSNRWVTLSNIVRTLSIEHQKNKKE